MTVSKSSGYVPKAKLTIDNPSVEELRGFISEMPNSKLTLYGSYNVQTRVDARSASSTYIVSDHPERHTGQVVPSEEAQRLANYQDEYIRDQEMVIVDGMLGNAHALATPARLIIERRNANIAAMQRTLYFDPMTSGQEPEITIVYTPNLPVPGYPSDRCILVDLEAGVTRVMSSDYFGESKKGGLRMWNKKVYDAGGLALHAGCKVIPVDGKERVFLIVGLSGTGKTTTTFTVQNDSRPVQDDFVALMPGGEVMATENGCFAKTFSLSPETEPTIYNAVILPTSYLENVSQKEEGGPVDFFDDNYTQNGRAVFSMMDLGSFREARGLGSVDVLLILNKNENIIPAVARLTPEQAAAYFMLGETQGTSAGGKEEMGKFLRVPGTNPFFPLRDEQQGNRFLELQASRPFEVFLMNTGRVGGPDQDPQSKKIKIPHSSAIVKGIAEGTISWERDPDFGYEVATGVPGIDDEELLRPRLLYQRQGRIGEYQQSVARLKKERVETLSKYPGLRKEILAVVT